MTDLAQGQAASAGTSFPSPLSIRPRPRAAAAGSGRSTARAALDDALGGIELTAVDRRFVSRISQWDKRNATTVAALIARARQAGRGEALTAGQLETVLAALADAFAYRTCGASAAGCWDCANRASGLCAEHARDADRAHAFAELTAVLAGESAAAAPDGPAAPAALPRPAAPAAQPVPTALPRLDARSGYRRRTAVAS